MDNVYSSTNCTSQTSVIYRNAVTRDKEMGLSQRVENCLNEKRNISLVIFSNNFDEFFNKDVSEIKKDFVQIYNLFKFLKK